METGVSPKKLNWDNKVSHVLKTIKPSGIRAFFDIVASREDIISLGVGEPDFVTPQVVIDRAIEALRNGFTHYTGNQGLLSLRKAISKYLEREYKLEYDPESEILVTVGVSEGVDLALRSVLNPGESVLYGEPSYVSYHPMISLAGGNSISVQTRLEDGFKLTPSLVQDALEANTKVLFLNYPSNPTGASLSRADLKSLAELVEERDLLVVSDEIYAELTFDFQHSPFPLQEKMRERTVLLGGFSKSFAMTGWRIGYAVGPKEWIAAMTKIHQYSMLCAPTISQIAAETALTDAISDRNRMRDEYRKRRDFVTRRMEAIGFQHHLPQGAFYFFPEISNSALQDIDFATQLLEEKSVAVVPGSAFGSSYHNFVRCAFASSMDDLRIALERIEDFVN